MRKHIYMIARSGIIGLASIALAACNSEPSVPKPAPKPVEIPSTKPPETSEAVSIIRPDVDVGQDAMKLQALDTRISFDAGGSDLTTVAIAELEAVLDTPQFKAGGAIILRGHTDSAGTDAVNVRASRKRAEAVRDWLVSKGVAESRIAVVAMGEQNQAKPNAKPDGTPDEAGRAYNRRVDVAIAVPAELAETAPEDEAPTLVEKVSAED